VRAPILASTLLLMAAPGCTDKPTPPQKLATRGVDQPTADPRPPAPPVEIANHKPVNGRCARTLCVAGPGALTDDANRDLGEMCRRSRGVVRHCEDQPCHSVWSLESWEQGLDALIDSLDHNRDGKVDALDEACQISVAGWSRGGMIAAEALPKALREDPRVSEDRAIIDHLVAIVPWAPEREHVEVGDNVRKAWIYRHTLAPAGDCSRAFAGGPWLSPAPICGPETTCWDYDFSLEPELAFLSRRGARSGAEIGHCIITALFDIIGLDNMIHGQEALAEQLPHYSNGEHGGRVHEPPPAPDEP